MAIAYVEHPLTKDEKKKYLKTFDKVLDIKFAPEKLADCDKKFEKSKAKAKTE